jgi:hypothetical protein
MLRRFLAMALGLALVLLGYVALQALRGGSTPLALRTALPAMRRPAVELQVAIHDLAEAADGQPPIRVCRALASRHVNLDVAAGTSLGDVLESLARQVEGGPVRVEGGWREPSIPTLACPDGSRDYLLIGKGGP